MSASSNMDMEDRVSHLEQKLQLQEDEIQLLKSALADALRRLGYCEEQTQGLYSGGAGRRPLAAAAAAQPTKGQWIGEMAEGKPLHAAAEPSVVLSSWICFTVTVFPTARRVWQRSFNFQCVNSCKLFPPDLWVMAMFSRNVCSPPPPPQERKQHSPLRGTNYAIRH